MIDEFSSGGLVVNKDKILVVYQDKTDSWALPKGHIDDGETKLESAKREIFEETGISDLTFIKELGSYQRGSRKSSDVRKNIVILYFTTTQNKLTSHDAENSEAKWVPIDEVHNILTYPKAKEFFLKIKKEIKK